MGKSNSRPQQIVAMEILPYPNSQPQFMLNPEGLLEVLGEELIRHRELPRPIGAPAEWIDGYLEGFAAAREFVRLCVPPHDINLSERAMTNVVAMPTIQVDNLVRVKASGAIGVVIGCEAQAEYPIKVQWVNRLPYDKRTYYPETGVFRPDELDVVKA